MKYDNTGSIICDSDSEEESARKVSRKQRLSECFTDDDRTEEVAKCVSLYFKLNMWILSCRSVGFDV